MSVCRTIQSWDYRRFDRTSDQIIPIEAREPFMTLKLRISILLDAYPFRWVLFAQPSDQINAILGEYRVRETDGIETAKNYVICL